VKRTGKSDLGKRINRRRFYRPSLEVLEERNGPTSLLAALGWGAGDTAPAVAQDTSISEEAVVDSSPASSNDTAVLFGSGETTDTSATFSLLTDTSYQHAEDASFAQGPDASLNANAQTTPQRVETPPPLGQDFLAQDVFADPLGQRSALAHDAASHAGVLGDLPGMAGVGQTASEQLVSNSAAVSFSSTQTTAPLPVKPSDESTSLLGLDPKAAPVPANSALPAHSGRAPSPVAPSSAGAAAAADLPAPTAGASVSPAQVAAALANQPLTFETNVGQTDGRVNFLVREPGYSLFLTPTEAVQRVQQPDGSGFTLGMQFVGARPDAQPVGLDPLPGRSNYILGNNPANWHSNIPHFGGVAYQDVYPGVNLVYHSTSSGQLEYDFVVAPGADPGTIGLQFQGADSVSLNGQGNLVLHTAAGNVVHEAPVLYQQTATGRQAVEGQFVVDGNQVYFAVGAYDTNRPLIIDPVVVTTPATDPSLDPRFTYYAQVGGQFDEQGLAVAVDAQGNTYVTGYTTSDDFPVTFGAFDPALNQNNLGQPVGGLPPPEPGGLGGGLGHLGGSGTPFLSTEDNPYQDAFVFKLDPNGNLVYATYLGGSGTDVGRGIAVDPLGQAYITGGTQSLDFPIAQDIYANPPRTGTHQQPLQTQLATPTQDNAFLFKLSADGSTDMYSTYFGRSRTVDSTLYLPGYPSPNVYHSLELWQIGNAAAVDQYGTAYFAGTTGGIQAIAVPSDQPYPYPDYNNISNGFVVKLPIYDPYLLQPPPLRYGGGFIRYFGGIGELDDPATGIDSATGIAVDPQQFSFYVTGSTNSPDFPVGPLPPANPSAYQTSIGRNANGLATYDAYVTKYQSGLKGSYGVAYSTFVGGSADDNGYAIAVDAAHNAYITGDTISTDYPTTPGAYQTQNNLNGLGSPTVDAFVTKLNPTGSALVYSTYLGGANPDHGYGIALNSAGEAYVTGDTQLYGRWTPPFPQVNPLVDPGPPPTPPSYDPGNRAFVTHVTADGTDLVFSSVVGGSVTGGRGIALDTAGVTHMAGFDTAVQNPNDVLVAVMQV
jgi:hypothetical protein